MRTSLEKIYRDYRQELYTCALAVTRCPSRAEDAVQDAFVRLLRLERRPVDLKVYVFRAVRNAAVDQIARRPAAEKKSVDAREFIFDTRAGPPEEASRREWIDRMGSRLLSLPDVEREAVVLHLWGNLTFREIARLLDTPNGTVASSYYRAIEKLRNGLKE